MITRRIQFVKDDDHPYHPHPSKNLLRDINTGELIMCAFDKHGYCRANCAAMVIEGPPAAARCSRMPGENVIAYIEKD